MLIADLASSNGPIKIPIAAAGLLPFIEITKVVFDTDEMCQRNAGPIIFRRYLLSAGQVQNRCSKLSTFS